MSEEDIKIQFLLPYLAQRGYKQNCMDFNVAIEVHEGRKKKTIFADVLVFTSAKRQAPLLLCETKAATEPLDRSVREQAISYARLLPRIAPLVLITNGNQTQVFHTLNKSRLADLPQRKSLDRDLLEFIVSADTRDALRQEAKHELFIIDDVQVFKGILKACHNEIRNNEGLDPTAAFDEMSKVLFCKLYEERHNTDNNRFRLAVFDDSLTRLGVNIVDRIFAEAKVAPAYKDLLPEESAILLKDRTTRRIVELFENYDLSLTAFDVKGEAFEYFLGDTFTGGLGEYFTPRNVVEFMVDAIDPKIGERIVDPFCGTGGFLIYAFEVVGEKIRLNDFGVEEKQRWRKELSDRCLFGVDWKERTSQACKMNMIIHGDGSSGIFMHDGFTDIPGSVEPETFDICLTNPPFGSFENDPTVLARYELAQGHTTQDRVILAVERCLALVKPRGLVALVVIDGVLNNPSMRYVRDYLRQHAFVRGVVSLNKETFEGYNARAKTSILFLERKASPDEGEQGEVFMAIARNTGLAPNGAPIPGNELPDILLEYGAFRKGQDLPGQHVSSGRFTLADRMDAEHYLRTATTYGGDVSGVRSQVREALAKSAAIQAVLEAAEDHFAQLSTRRVRLGDVLEEVREAVTLKSDVVYRMLGVKWWGEGVFIREELLGREIKSKRAFKATAGDIIYNRLFAYRGSFAMLEPGHDGCHASGEFPMFRVRSGIESPSLVARYVVHALNSPQFLAVVDAESTGSTKESRNRFNQRVFLAMALDLPDGAENLQRSLDLLDAAVALRREQANAHELAKNLRMGVLSLLPGPIA